MTEMSETFIYPSFMWILRKIIFWYQSKLIRTPLYCKRLAIRRLRRRQAAWHHRSTATFSRYRYDWLPTSTRESESEHTSWIHVHFMHVVENWPIHVLFVCGDSRKQDLRYWATHFRPSIILNYFDILFEYSPMDIPITFETNGVRRIYPSARTVGGHWLLWSMDDRNAAVD